MKRGPEDEAASGTSSPARAGSADPTNEAHSMGMLAHLLGAVLGCVLGPLGLIGPLMIWLSMRTDDPFIDEQGKEAINFQLHLLIWHAGAFVLAVAGFALFSPHYVPRALSLVFGLLGARDARRGTSYRYPFTTRVIR